MKGWIFGGEHQKTWTQKIYKYTNKFQNPLHQNYKHTKTIESLLELNKDKIFLIVSIVGDSTFKSEMPSNVTQCGSFINSKTAKLFSKKDVDWIIKMIESGQLTKSFKTNREHVKNIVKENDNKRSCTKCGSALVLRVAKKGINKGNEFYGCSNYPKCRYRK